MAVDGSFSVEYERIQAMKAKHWYGLPVGSLDPLLLYRLSGPTHAIKLTGHSIKASYLSFSGTWTHRRTQRFVDDYAPTGRLCGFNYQHIYPLRPGRSLGYRPNHLGDAVPQSILRPGVSFADSCFLGYVHGWSGAIFIMLIPCA